MGLDAALKRRATRSMDQVEFFQPTIQSLRDRPIPLRNYTENAWSMIGKTRQDVEIVFDPEVGGPRGVLNPPPAAGKFRLSRRSPAPELALYVQHYWMVTWDLRGQPPFSQETLPHPNVHAVFEQDRSAVCGVSTSKFTRVLEGQSQVFGIKFTPGGLHPFLKSSVSALTDRGTSLARVFGNEVTKLESLLVSSGDEDERIAAANGFLVSRQPDPDPTVALANQLVGQILREPALKTVDDLARRTGIGKRSLQRMFNEYVGINPKWVIRRYRLHEVVERLKSGERLDLSQLALELGYFDQPHLINDFRSIVGYSPAQYQGMIRSSS
jgi:AraC-like DNA-binding protein